MKDNFKVYSLEEIVEQIDRLVVVKFGKVFCERTANKLNILSSDIKRYIDEGKTE